MIEVVGKMLYQQHLVACSKQAPKAVAQRGGLKGKATAIGGSAAERPLLARPVSEWNCQVN